LKKRPRFSRPERGLEFAPVGARRGKKKKKERKKKPKGKRDWEKKEKKKRKPKKFCFVLFFFFFFPSLFPLLGSFSFFLLLSPGKAPKRQRTEFSLVLSVSYHERDFPPFLLSPILILIFFFFIFPSVRVFAVSSRKRRKRGGDGFPKTPKKSLHPCPFSFLKKKKKKGKKNPHPGRKNPERIRIASRSGSSRNGFAAGYSEPLRTTRRDGGPPRGKKKK
jgi:hypothetical protein